MALKKVTGQLIAWRVKKFSDIKTLKPTTTLALWLYINSKVVGWAPGVCNRILDV
jgi:hypothetical protein